MSGKQPVEFDPFAGPALERTAPSTESQREIWTAAQLGDEASIAFNESCTLELEGSLDVAALRAALADLVARHEATRITFSPDGTTLCVAAELPLPLEIQDLAELPAAEREARVAALLQERVTRPFALEAGPLVRFDLVRTAPGRHLLVLTAHHLVCDGFSTGVLFRDLAALYSARRMGRVASLPPAFPFSAYAAEQLERQRTPAHADDERFWVSRFAGTAPVLDLPTDRPRPRLKTFASRRHDHTFPPDLVAALKKSGARSGASLFVTVLAAVDVLLQRLTGQEDLVVGIASAGQATSGHNDLVGHCVNTLPIRAAVAPDAPFTAVLQAVRTAVLDAQEHSEYTFGSLIRQLALPRDPARLPLVSVLFNLDPGLSAESFAFDGLGVTFRSNPRAAENFDLFLNGVEGKAGLTLECQYNTDLLDEATVRRWYAVLEKILRAVAERPETPVGQIPILPEEDARQLAAWNATEREWPRDRLLHQLVEETVDRTPDAVAIRFGDEAVTYRDYERRANQLARHLAAAGAGPEALVGVALDRTPEMLVALLAIHKAGAGYVPLDPAFPAERLASIVNDSGMALLVTQRSIRAAIPAGRARVIELDGADQAAIAAQPGDRTPPAATPAATAYVLYTSGSTGKPKGVAVPVGALVNLLWSAREFPGLQASDRMVAITTISFDIAEVEVWLPLLVGSTVILAGRDVAGDGAQLLALLQKSNANVLQATPATWRILLEAGWTGRPGFRGISTGEALPRDLALRLVEELDVLDDMYGPTETTIWSTGYRLPKPLGQVLIGKPLANQQIHVLDPRGQRLPIGVPGELFIAGEGVARGYLGLPDLTAERFLPDPFAGVPGARMYRTGDVVRLKSDGNVEYFGRNDGQVKIRGFRIEVGEVEAALARHPAVAAAVVVAREPRPGDARLMAYVVARADAGVEPSALEETFRKHVRGILPEYMVPQHVIRMDAFPLTSSGKVDRKKLPMPELGRRADAAYVAPRTPAEERVAKLWQAALGLPQVSVTDDFFALGGHSLLAAQVVARLAREDGISIPMRKMFEAPTIEAFAALLDASRPVPELPRLAGDGPAPVSFMQERVWNLDRLQPGRTDFNLPAAFHLRGRLDQAALQRALDAFAARHEAVRTTLLARDGEVLQAVLPEVRLPISPIPLPGAPGPEQDAALLQDLLAASVEPFDLEKGPLMRARLYRCAPEEHVLFILPHHAIWDGWSFDLFVRDLAELYAAACEGRPARLPALTVRYRDFAAWHRGWLQSPEVQAQAAWWRDQLSGEVASLELPTDRPRPRTKDSAGDTLWVQFTAAEMNALSAIAQENGATLFQAMLAAFQTVLHRWSGQDDIVVGSPLRGRPHPGLEDVVGTFINTILLRTRFDGAPTFLELLGRVRTTVTEALAHEDVPFELLTMSRKPAFRALFSFQDVRARPLKLGDLEVSQVHVIPRVAANDVSLWIMQRDTGLTGGFNFATALFDRSTAEAMLESLVTVVRAAIADPRQAVARLDRGPRATVLDGGPAPRPALVHAAFEQHLAVDPARPAVVAQGPEAGAPGLTRGELDARARRLQAALRAAGAGAGSRVAVALDGGPDGLAALLAAARLGATVLPLDRDEPPARLRQLADRARPAACVVADADAAEALGCPRIEAAPAPDAAPAPAVDPGAIALVVPRFDLEGEGSLVELSHAALAAAIDGVRARAALGTEDVLGVAAGDPGRQVLAAWLALSAGTALLPLDPDASAAEVASALQGAKATALLADAAVLAELLDAGFRGGERFRVIGAGEPLAPELALRLGQIGRPLLLHGEAEGGFWWSAADGVAGGARPCTGRPLPGVRLAVVDGAGEPVPQQIFGTLEVQGATLSTGAAPLRTGLAARLGGGGALELSGHAVGEAVVRGRRVDLRAVERAMRACPGIADAAVLPGAGTGSTPGLVGWWVPAPGGEADGVSLRRHLRRLLPRHAVPLTLIEVERIPRRAGAVDRAALPARQRGEESGAEPPRNETERLVAQLWQAALGVAEVSVGDNFFDLGGHSLACLQLVEQLAARTGKRIPPTALLQENLEAVAARLEPREPR